MPSKCSPGFFGFTPATKQLRPLAYSRQIRVWNCPVLPVIPCVMTLVFLLTRMLISTRTFRGGFHHLLRRLRHVVCGNDRQTRISQNFSSEVLVRALHPHDQRHLESDRPRCRDHALRDDVAAHDATEDV